MKKRVRGPRRNKRGFSPGFTLVEMVVVVALLSLLTAGVALLIQPTLETSRLSIYLSQDKLLARTIMEQLRQELTYAVKDSVAIDPDGAGMRLESVSLGQLQVASIGGRVSVSSGGKEIGLEEEVYMGRKATAAFSSPYEGCVKVEIVIYDGLTESFRMTEYVTLMNQTA